MTDNEIETRLARYAVAAPAAGLAARIERTVRRRQVRGDFIGGWCVAAAAVMLAVLAAFVAAPTSDERLTRALEDPEHATMIELAIEVMGGGSDAIDYVLLTERPGRAAGELRTPVPLGGNVPGEGLP